MLRHTKFRPYIRRLRHSDKSNSFRIAMRLAFFAAAGWDGYVLVQRGFRHNVIDVARTRRELMRSPIPVWAGRKTFKQWAKDVQKAVQ